MRDYDWKDWLALALVVLAFIVAIIIVLAWIP